MVWEKNSAIIVGMIGMLVIIFTVSFGDKLYLHRSFSYSRKDNLKEVYRFVGIETIIVTSGISLFHGILGILELAKRIDFNMILLFLGMSFFGTYLCHGVSPMAASKYTGVILFTVILFPTVILLLLVYGDRIASNDYLMQLSIVFFLLNLFLILQGKKSWGNNDYR